MGNLYRFVEPIVLLLLRQKGHSYGYDLSAEMQEHALTDAEIDKGALYRALRQLEMNGNVESEWETKGSGPARRMYRLTSQGERHLEEWANVLEHLSKSMAHFVRDARKFARKPTGATARSAQQPGHPFPKDFSTGKRPASTRRSSG
jgi:DNA-binding PadR family transcriptional regulator